MSSSQQKADAGDDRDTDTDGCRPDSRISPAEAAPLDDLDDLNRVARLAPPRWVGASSSVQDRPEKCQGRNHGRRATVHFSVYALRRSRMSRMSATLDSQRPRGLLNGSSGC